MIDGSRTITQELSFSDYHLNTPLPSEPNELLRRIDAAADAERNRKKSPDADLKPAPVIGNCSAKHPDLCCRDIAVILEPLIIVTSTILKKRGARVS